MPATGRMPWLSARRTKSGMPAVLWMSVSARVRTPALCASSRSTSGFITPYLKLNQLCALRIMIDDFIGDLVTHNIADQTR